MTSLPTVDGLGTPKRSASFSWVSPRCWRNSLMSEGMIFVFDMTTTISELFHHKPYITESSPTFSFSNKPYFYSYNH